MEFEDALSAAFGTGWHLSGLVFVANPERLLNLALLLRVAQALTRILCSHDVEKFVFLRDLSKVVGSLVDELF